MSTVFFPLWKPHRLNIRERIIVCLLIDADYNSWVDSMRVPVSCLLFAKDGGRLNDLHDAELLYLRVLVVVAFHKIWPLIEKISRCAPRILRSKLYPTYVLWVHGWLIFAASELFSSGLLDVFWRVLGRIFEIEAVYHATTWSHFAIFQSNVFDRDGSLCIPIYAEKCSKSWK